MARTYCVKCGKPMDSKDVLLSEDRTFICKGCYKRSTSFADCDHELNFEEGAA